MSVRSTIQARVVQNSPPGTDAVLRTRALMHTLITNFYPKVVAIEIADVPVCAEEDADEYLYLGDAHCVMVHGGPISLRYGTRISLELARHVREAGLEAVPVRAIGVTVEHPSVPSLVTDEGEASNEGETGDEPSEDDAEPSESEEPATKRKRTRKRATK